MNTYVLVNPSDDYTFEAPDDAVATTLVSVLNGMLAWERDGTTGGLLDLLTPGTTEAEEALALCRGVLNDRPTELAAAMRTLEIKGEQRVRLGVDAEAWHDEMRTSASDYRAAALRYAGLMEKNVALGISLLPPETT